jgi:hypothetical protein
MILVFLQDMITSNVPSDSDLNITLTPGVEHEYDIKLWLTARRLKIIYDPVAIEPTSGDFAYVNSVGFLETAENQEYEGFVIEDIPIS